VEKHRIEIKHSPEEHPLIDARDPCEACDLKQSWVSPFGPRLAQSPKRPFSVAQKTDSYGLLTLLGVTTERPGTKVTRRRKCLALKVRIPSIL